jgi:mitochondrial fusion and transport protein UGO1
MPSTTLKRRRTEEGMSGKLPKKVKKIKRQRHYHSSSEDEDGAEDQDFAAVNLEDSDNEADIVARPIPKPARKPAPQDDDIPEGTGASDDDASLDKDNTDMSSENSEQSDGSASDSDTSKTSTNAPVKKRKRNDPDAFATSMSKILSSKLSTSKRTDPVLSRSKDAATASKELSEARLETKARGKLREEKKATLDRGRVKDILGLENVDTSTAEILEEEKRLKKTAQRGVIKLFNAVRAAQVKGEEAAREARQKGLVGIGKREEKVTEMTKKGFLDMIAGGGKKPKEGSVEA